MRAFVEVARRGSFAAASRQLGLSTSSVSRLVIDLEDWLQAPLFRRTTRSLTLTDAGERYLERCREILTAWDDLEKEARAATEKPRGKLHVAGAAYPMRKLITPLLPHFLASYPDVQLHLHLQDKPIDLIAEGVDIAIRIGELIDSSMIARKFGDVGLKLAASPTFLERYGTPKSLNELPSFPCLVDTTSRYGHRWPIGQRLNVDGPITANDGEIIRQMTLAGSGISLLPDFFVEDDIAEGRLIELLSEDLTDRIGIYTLLPARRQITPAARVFADYVVRNSANRAWQN